VSSVPFCAHPAERLILEVLAIAALGANVLDADDIGTYAVECALRHWKVFLLRGKTPAIPSAHPEGDPMRGKCRGECGRHGHGVLDATTDLATIISWWGGRYAGCNIGARLPEKLVVIDTDPRNGGLVSRLAMLNKHGPMPDTLTSMSGRGDGGHHLFYLHPGGKLTDKRLGPGVDIKTSGGYVVFPPSIHPATGRPYGWIERPIVAPPAWLVELLQVVPEQHPARLTGLRPMPSLNRGQSIADQYNNSTSWCDVLEPHGWRCLDADTDTDGARWRHPHATAPHSANVRGGRLYVWSPNTPFDTTEAGTPNGYSRFSAYAVLNHRGDMRAAAATLRKADSK
jgi:hypothetical protein